MKNYLLLILVLLISSFSFTQTDDQKKLDFSKKVRDADMLFAQGKFLDAKKTYEEAAMLFPNDASVKKQIAICEANEKKKSGGEEQKEYNKIINKADEKFKSGDYQGAKDLFLRATKIKSTDPYPPKMLKQIEDLLNPKPIEKAEPLPKLGETSDLSIEEAQKALKKADMDRKIKQQQLVEKKNEDLAKNENDFAANRLKEMESKGVNLAQVKNKMDSLLTDNKHGNDSLNIKFQHETNSVASISDFQQQYQHDLKVYVDQTITKKVNKQDSLGYGANQVGKNNDSLFYSKSHQDDLAATNVDKKMQETRAGVEQNLNTITYKEEKKHNDNRVSKEEITELVNETNENILDLEKALDDKNRKNSSEMTESNLIFTEKGDARDREMYKKAGINDEYLKSKEQQNVKSNDSLATHPLTIRNATTDSIALMYQKSEFITVSTIDSNRYITASQVNASSKNVNTDFDEITKSQNEYRIKSEEEILRQKNVHTTLEETSKTKQDNTAKELVKAEQQQTEELIAASTKETTETFSSKDKINNLESKVLVGLAAEKSNVTGTQTNINTLENTIQGAASLQGEEKNIKNLEARTMLENIEKREVKFDDKAANSIGSLYPEGVTQEQFEKKDENGLLESVVTRRIVVKNGYGQVYTRTQTADTITYSKNGAPSTEFVWQKETQDAKLKKN
jgi:hypothetical protein